MTAPAAWTRDVPLAEWSPGQEDWEYLQKFLPVGWREEARRCGALRRARGFKDAEVLLRVLLIHIANGCSLVETAVRARELGLAEVSAVAIFARLRGAEEWLRHLAVGLRGAQPFFPGRLGSRRVRAIDATTISEPGSTGTDWRVHYALNLADLSCDFFELTDRYGGEKWSRFPLAAGDVLLSDRAYATPPGIFYAAQQQAQVVVRLNLQSLPLQSRHGPRLDPLVWARKEIPPSGPQEVAADVVLRREGGRVRKTPRLLPGRLLGVRCNSAVTERARRQVKDYGRRHGGVVSARATEAAEYFLLWTNLEEGTAQTQEVLELYRLRWQVELAFKRLKSLMSLGQLPKKDPASCRAWLYGKLLVGLLTEAMVRAGETFSPWGYDVRERSAQSLAGD